MGYLIGQPCTQYKQNNPAYFVYGRYMGRAIGSFIMTIRSFGWL